MTEPHDPLRTLGDARAIVTAVLSGDTEMMAMLVTEAEARGITRDVMLCLAGMLAGLVTSVADAKDREPQEFWQDSIARLSDLGF